MARYLNSSVEEAHEKLWEIIVRYENESIGLKKLGIPIYDFYRDVYEKIDISEIQYNLSLHNAFKVLFDQGNYNMVLITNSSITHADRVLKRLNIYQFFDKIYGFENLNFKRKPNRDVFLHILKETNYNPESISYFDDSMPNLYVAHQLGLNTCLVSNGLRKPPYFYELHFGVEHLKPMFTNDCTYNLTEKLMSYLK